MLSLHEASELRRALAAPLTQAGAGWASTGLSWEEPPGQLAGAHHVFRTSGAALHSP